MTENLHHSPPERKWKETPKEKMAYLLMGLESESHDKKLSSDTTPNRYRQSSMSA